MENRALKQAVRAHLDGDVLHFELHGAAFSLESDGRNTTRAEIISRGQIDSSDAEFVTWLSERGLLELPRYDLGLPEQYVRRHDRTIRFLASHETDDVSAMDMLSRLHASRVLVVGLGGVGSWIAYSLLMAGIGTVVGVDGDVVDVSNLNRSALYRPAHVGRAKADVLANELNDRFPDQVFSGCQEWIESASDVAKFARDVDFVVSAADTPHRVIRMWVREGARSAGAPVIETMGGAIGPIRGGGGVAYDADVSVSRDGRILAPVRNLNAVARGPGVPPYHPMTDAAGVCQAVFETVAGSRISPLKRGYVRKGSVVNVGEFHEMESSD